MADETKGAPAPGGGESSTHPVDDPYGYEDPYGSAAGERRIEAPAPAALTVPPKPPPPAPPVDEEQDDDDGMLRMSFMEHLEELRSRIIKMLMGVGVAFVVSIVFAPKLWEIVSEPATVALRNLGFPDKLAQLAPMEVFSTVWVKLPMLTSIFLASPWVLYQVWAFIAPGLYKRERRWAAPFVICSAGLFIFGGLFAYFVAFRYGIEFLLGIGRDIKIQPVVSVSEYFDLFVNVTLGIGIVFELPVLIFFLTLLRIVTPAFLLRNSRYAILIIVLIAAVVTPTPDVFNLMMFVIPMVTLFFVGVFAGYLLTLHRENRRFPWGIVALIVLATLGIAGGAIWVAVARYGYKLVDHWPYLVR